jgi:hypothetical protein
MKETPTLGIRRRSTALNSYDQKKCHSVDVVADIILLGRRGRRYVKSVSSVAAAPRWTVACWHGLKG